MQSFGRFRCSERTPAAANTEVADAIPLSLLPQLTVRESLPLYVSIYDAFYHLVCSGKVRSGQGIPGEIALSEHWGVSRGTVRQALRYLEEDGFIIKARGKGSIIGALNTLQDIGVQACFDVCRSCCLHEITRTEASFAYTGAGDWTGSALKVEKGSLYLLASLYYYDAEGECCAFAQRFIPVPLLEAYSVDVTDQAALHAFATDTIDSATQTMDSTVCVLTDDHSIPGNNGDIPVLFFEELFYARQDEPIAFVKNYLRSDVYRLALHRRARYQHEFITPKAYE